VTDLFGFDLVDGLASGECTICHALARHTRRWLDSFWREGRQDPRTRKRFYAGGGFCPRHAWLLHDLVDGSGAAIADVYGRLADQDLARVSEVLGSRRARRRTLAAGLRRIAPCSACAEELAALPRKAEFFLELIADDAARRSYEQAAGLCYPHLLAVLEAAGDREAPARYLLEDWRHRLEELRGRLADYDRKRDHRHAAERRAEDQESWTDIIRHYVGPPPDEERQH